MRALLMILSAYHGANGLFMLAAPQTWYHTIPGVAGTGPANVHFIRDVGLGFLAAALALFCASRTANANRYVLLVLVFLGGHALLHLAEFFHHAPDPATFIRDLFTIIIPSLLPVLALRSPIGGRP